MFARQSRGEVDPGAELILGNDPEQAVPFVGDSSEQDCFNGSLDCSYRIALLFDELTQRRQARAQLSLLPTVAVSVARERGSQFRR